MAETVDRVADQIASSNVNGREDVVADGNNENGIGSAKDEQEDVETEKDQASHLSEVQQKSSVPDEGEVAPERRAEVRQMGLPVSAAIASSSVVKKDIATVTSPVEIKQIKIGDPKTRSKLCFEVVTARVMETAGKKHVAYTIIMK